MLRLFYIYGISAIPNSLEPVIGIPQRHGEAPGGIPQLPGGLGVGEQAVGAQYRYGIGGKVGLFLLQLADPFGKGRHGLGKPHRSQQFYPVPFGNMAQAVQHSADAYILCRKNVAFSRTALFTAAQHVAALNPQVCTEVYDILLYPALKERYNVMSVPCLVLEDGQVIFGRRTLDALLTLLGV